LSPRPDGCSTRAEAVATISIVKSLSAWPTVFTIVLLSGGQAHAESYREEEASGSSPEGGVSESERGQTETDGLRAGDLKPPSGDIDDKPRDDRMAKELERSDRKDSGRGLEYFWLSGDVGAAFFDLDLGSDGRMLPGLRESGLGVAYGGGLGVRVLYFSVGARFRAISLSDYDVYTAGLELGLKFPLGAFEPFARLGLGYLGSLRAEVQGQSLTVSGFSTRLSGGADYYFSDAFSLGAELGLNVDAASRGKILNLPTAAPPILGEDTSSLAMGAELMLNVGFHL
jgi:hypothetical protein